MDNILLVGNTGVGKSTILNLFGASFAADFSLIDGLTTKTDYVEVKVNGKQVRLIDAPGLVEVNDERIAENAKELTEALTIGGKSGGKYKLVFVYQSNGGRLLAEDVYTTAKVCKAINHCLDVGLIFNKTDEEHMDKYSNQESLSRIAQTLSKATNGRLSADHIIALEYRKTSERHTLKPKLLEYIHKLCPDVINEVKPIHASVKEISAFVKWMNTVLTVLAATTGVVLTLPLPGGAVLWKEFWTLLGSNDFVKNSHFGSLLSLGGTKAIQ
ncbi:hypothetical protein BGZ96_006056 [Linnemannia gamsii]|uniref:G domain-containing protein n=1 Tax=Linnemannia gamsii TaxID=64522 RepID=A0ABQ7K306_9FUNG|nr:hypothetical protein BGZ96_006056 [Linnemannia gamsii]